MNLGLGPQSRDIAGKNLICMVLRKNVDLIFPTVYIYSLCIHEYKFVAIATKMKWTVFLARLYQRGFFFVAESIHRCGW